MKKTLIIALLLHISIAVLAQKSYKEQFDNQSGIKKEQVKTGILYNRVMPWAKLDEFGINKDYTTDTKRFMQAWYELQLASYQNASPLNLQNLQDVITSHNWKRQIPIGLLNYEFNYLDSSALANKNYEHIGTKQVQMVVALQTEKIKAGEISFVFNPVLAFGNLYNNIAQIRINVGENNQIISFTPPSKILIIKHLK